MQKTKVISAFENNDLQFLTKKNFINIHKLNEYLKEHNLTLLSKEHPNYYLVADKRFYNNLNEMELTDKEYQSEIYNFIKNFHYIVDIIYVSKLAI